METIKNWREEKQSAYLYQVMAESELDPVRKNLFQLLAKAADKQAGIWESELNKRGIAQAYQYHPDFRIRLVAWLVRQLGTKPLRPILGAMKVRGMSIYNEASPGHPLPVMGNLEQRHKAIGLGGNLRAAVFGVNDGLLSNVTLILGVAGATMDQHFIIVSGVAGLLAGAFSMSAGEYVSVSSQRELYENQINLERSELQLYPAEEVQELATIYRARGLPELSAQELAQLILSDPEKGLDTLLREELGINIKDLGNPRGAALSSFLSFVFGAFIPLLPFLCGNHRWNLFVSVGVTSLALFAVGASISLFTSRNAFKSGIRMLSIGVAVGCFTYFIGKLLGVMLQ